MTEQYQLKLSLPGNSVTLRTADLGVKRRYLIGTEENCDQKFSCSESFVVSLTREHDQWALVPVDEITKLYALNGNGQYQEQAVFVLMDRGAVSVCSTKSGTLEEVMQVSMNRDCSETVNTKYDLRIQITDRDMVTVGPDDCSVSFDGALVMNNSIKMVRSGRDWKIEPFNSGSGYVNTTYIQGQMPLYDHDFITVGAVRLYYMEGNLYTAAEFKPITRGMNVIPVRESAGALNYPVFVRSTRIQHQVVKDKIDLQQPAKASKQNEDNMLLRLLPSVTMMISMLLMRAGQGGSALTMVLYTGVSMGSSVLVTILTRKDSKKKAEEEALNRKNHYYQYIQSKVDEINQHRQDEMRILERIYRSEEDNINIVRNFDKGLFDRAPGDQDFLDIRLGRGRRKAEMEVTINLPEYRETEDELTGLAEQVVEKYKYLDNAPIVANLGKDHSIGVVGRRKWLYEMVKTMTLDLIVRHYFKDVKLYYVIDEEDCEQFSWIRWLQNCQAEDNPGCRTILCDDESTKLYLESLYRLLSARQGIAKDRGQKWNDFHIIFVYRIDIIRNHPISQFFENCESLGVRFIFMDEHEERIPRGCTEMIRLDNAGNTGVLFNTKAMEQAAAFEYVPIMADRMEEIVRKLAPVRVVESSLDNEMSKSITLFELLGIHSAEDLDFDRLWSQSNIVKSMGVPLGVRTKNAVQYLDIHEKAHGPHGLVAGTTGSGKSEILQSYLINLAVYFPPDEVNYLLIDFKGGGMSNLFEGLPHLTGAITDIDGREIERSLKAIRAELERRKRLFERARVNKIDDYIRMRKQDPESVPVALPHLIIVVDEFAELKAEQPDFMKELISTARVGRSLGVHLILATQKPSGVVDPQIVSNSRFRLCLKVASKEDSNEMINTPLAAEIREPGRAYIQVGNNEIFELFQSAYSGGHEPSASAQTVRPFTMNELNLWGRQTPVYRVEAPKDTSGETIRQRSELEAVRDTIIEHCKQKGIQPLQKVCLPAMPTLVPLSTLAAPTRGLPGTVLIAPAFYDDPEEHYQGPYTFDLSQNNLFLIGASQMGKTEALISMIHQAVMNYEATEVNFYIIDAGNLALNVFDGCPHIGAVVDYRNEDMVDNTMKFIRQMVDARREKMMADGVGTYLGYCATGKKDMPLAVLVIDNIAAFREFYEKHDETLQALAREGMSAGVTLIFTGTAMNNLHYRIQASFTMKICLTINETSEYVSITGTRGFEPHTLPGCCLVPLGKRTVEAQFGLPLYPELDEELKDHLEGEEDRQRAWQILSKDDKRRMDLLKQALMSRFRTTEGRALRIPMVPITLILEEALERNPEYFGIPGHLVVGMEYKSVEYVPVSLPVRIAIMISGKQTESIDQVIVSFLRQTELAPENTYEVYVLDSSRRSLFPYRTVETVQVYTNDPERIPGIFQKLETELKQRQDELYAAEEEAKEELKKSWPYKVIVINDSQAIQAVNGNKDCQKILQAMLTEYNECNCAMIWGRYPNARPGYGDDLGKQMVEQGTVIYCDRISTLKLADTAGTYRTLTREYIAGDAYIHEDGEFKHIKTFVG